MKNVFLLLAILIVCSASAQLYSVKGKVTGVSIEPLPFVSVHVRDQVNNVVTNEAGEFKTTLENGKYTFIFTCMGYETYTQDVIVNNQDVFLNLILKENPVLLNEVEVNTKYSDPARGLVQKVIQNKHKYVQTSYQCDLYIKAVESENKYKSRKDSLHQVKQHTDSLNNANKKNEIALSDTAKSATKITPSDSIKISKKKKIFAKDSVKHAPKELQYDKLNMEEVVIKKSFEHPNKLKEERIGVEKRGDISGLFYLSTSEGEFNFYQNAVYCPSISSIPIQSPLSTSGLVMYKYKTLKVFIENGLRIYRIKVEPNLFGNALVTGEMEIVDSLYCLRSLKFNFPKHQLAEYTSFEMQSEFVPYNDSLYYNSKMTFDYKTGSEKNGSHGKTDVFVENFKYEKGFDKKYFTNEVSTTLKEAYNKDSTFWQQVRKEPLNDKEMKFIRIEDSIKIAHRSKPYLDSIDKQENKITFMKVAFLGQTKYNRVKELRVYFEALAFCYQPVGVGGARLRYGVGGYKKFTSKKTLFISGDVNYGILNRDLNGSVSTDVLYNPFRRSFWGMDIGRNYDIVNASDTWTAIFRTSNYYLNEHISAYHWTELFNGFYWKIKFEYSTRKSIVQIKNDSLTNLFLDNGKAKSLDFNFYDAFYITNTLSYTPAQKYIREPYEKIILGSRFPTFSVSYRKGIPNVFHSSIDFDYLEYSISQDIDFRFLGISKIRFSTGKFYNTNSIKTIDYKYQPRVGFPFFGNPLTSFQSLEKSYITIDRFYTGQYFHRFNGALINKIPYVKYLKVTESAGGGFLVSDENSLVYFEGYVGLEKNIRIFKEMFRLGIYFVDGKTNNFPNTTGFRIAIDNYDRVRNKWRY